MWKKYGLIENKISVPSIFTLEKPHLFKPCMIELPIVIRMSPLDFPDTFDRNINNEVDEISMIFTSYLKDITLFHYMDQPKSMIQRKLIKKVNEEDYGNLDYNWLPKCFGNINT